MARTSLLLVLLFATPALGADLDVEVSPYDTLHLPGVGAGSESSSAAPPPSVACPKQKAARGKVRGDVDVR